MCLFSVRIRLQAEWLSGWFLVKMVNVDKCFKIVFSIRKNINTFALKLGPRFKEMALLKFFIIEIQVPGSQTYTAGDLISHTKSKKAKTITEDGLHAPLLEHSI
jgi:hypothetical protein